MYGFPVAKVHVAALFVGLLSMQSPAFGLELAFPGPAERTASRTEANTSVRLPIGPFAAGSLPTELTEGALEQVAYRITLPTPSTLDLIGPLRAQAQAAGFDILFECDADACGGFDFRYGTDVLPEPDMHVDLGDFRYLLARRGAEVLALMVSRTGSLGFVQVTRVAGSTALATKVEGLTPDVALPAAQETAGSGAVASTDLIAGLTHGKAQVLEDLVFASGSAALVEGEYASLLQLGAWLAADPDRKVILVGHTDASGAAAANLRLSILRAESVRQALLFAHKIAPNQIEADGTGSLAPRASNLTEAGRKANRRVEVMMTSTELLKP